MYALWAGLVIACDDSVPSTSASTPDPVAAPAAEEPPPAEAPEPQDANSGRLLVLGGASGAAVFVDGEKVGLLPMAEPGAVSPGDHELKILDMKTGRGQELSIHIEAGALLEIPAE